MPQACEAPNINTIMRKILLTLTALFCLCTAQADEKKATLITDTNVSIDAADIDYLLAADDEDLFTVVLKSGDPVQGVRSLLSESAATGIADAPQADGEHVQLPTRANSTLQLSGLEAGTGVEVYSADGRLVKKATAQGGDLTIGVADLPQGTYVLKTAKSEVKFVKQ